MFEKALRILVPTVLVCLVAYFLYYYPIITLFSFAIFSYVGMRRKRDEERSKIIDGMFDRIHEDKHQDHQPNLTLLHQFNPESTVRVEEVEDDEAEEDSNPKPKKANFPLTHF